MGLGRDIPFLAGGWRGLPRFSEGWEVACVDGPVRLPKAEAVICFCSLPLVFSFYVSIQQIFISSFFIHMHADRYQRSVNFYIVFFFSDICMLSTPIYSCRQSLLLSVPTYISNCCNFSSITVSFPSIIISLYFSTIQVTDIGNYSCTYITFLLITLLKHNFVIHFMRDCLIYDVFVSSSFLMLSLYPNTS